MNLAVLLRPPDLTWVAQADMRAKIRDLKLAKAKASHTTQQAALELGKAKKLVAVDPDTHANIVAKSIVVMVQKHLYPQVIRRSNDSVDYTGTKLTADLLPCTEVLVSITVSGDEVAELNDVTAVTFGGAKYFSTNDLGVRTAYIIYPFPT